MLIRHLPLIALVAMTAQSQARAQARAHSPQPTAQSQAGDWTAYAADVSRREATATNELAKQ